VSLRRGLALVALLLVAFLVVRESREPTLWLFVDDLLHPKPAPFTLPLSEDLAVRLYTDTRPHVGKVARLQKGLVLVRRDRGEDAGQDLVEEGFGFGLPLVEVAGQAYLSRSASVQQVGNALIKRFEMDTVDTPSGFLRRKYEPVPPIGAVTITYPVVATEGEDGGSIALAVDLSDLEAPWDKVYVMNEQGARLFTRYEEPGLVVEGEQLGKWQPASARQGCMVTGDGSMRFCVETDAETRRYYGRERYNQYYWVGVYVLSWAGIDLELESPLGRFDYRVTVDGASHE
jgi:hypothetical protein